MSRLPTPGQDSGQWGTILNEYLSQVHTASGNLKPGVVSADHIADSTITTTKIDNQAVTTDKLASGAVTGSRVADGSIASTKLDTLAQASLTKAETAYQKPTPGIPDTDLTQEVQVSLSKADGAVQASGQTGAVDLSGTTIALPTTTNGLAAALSVSGDLDRLVSIKESYSASLALPMPLLDLNYQERMALYGVETFTRTGTDTYTDIAGITQTAAENTAPFDRVNKSGSLVPLGLKCLGAGTSTATFNPVTLLGLLPANEYTIVLDIERPSAYSGDGTIFSLDGGSVTNRIQIGVNSSYQPSFTVQTGGVVVVNQSLGAVQCWYGGPRRLVLAVKGSAFTCAFDGMAYNTISSGSAPTRTNLTNFRLGGNGYGTSFFTGWVKRCRILPIALSQQASVDLSAGETPVACWGDSMTAGGGSNVWTEVLRAVKSPHSGVFNGGVGGETSTQIRVRAIADTIRNQWTTVIWAGRNNYNTPETVLADVQAIVSNLAHDRFLVMSVTNRADGTEDYGTAPHTTIVALNEALEDAFPRNYLDIRSLIVTASGGTNDAPDIDWTTDGLHLNNTGHAYVASQVGARLRTHGWY